MLATTNIVREMNVSGGSDVTYDRRAAIATEILYGYIAQCLEHSALTRKVAGETPAGATTLFVKDCLVCTIQANHGR